MIAIHVKLTLRYFTISVLLLLVTVFNMEMKSLH